MASPGAAACGGGRRGIEPHAYFANVISKIVNGHPNSQIDDLLPWAYPVATVLQDVA